jgi:hypothetical protein
MDEKFDKAVMQISEEHKARMREKWLDEKLFAQVLDRVCVDRERRLRAGVLVFQKSAYDEAKEWYYE